jgi:prepilin-type N-terminal cleavage/methylation domain-containing protein
MAKGRNRRGFSLMELILATAVLAASGAALFGLIGQGAMFAGRAQRESFALHLAQSVIDEFLAMPGEVETEGTFVEDETWAYRITSESVDAGDATGGDATVGGLTRLVVEVMPAGATGSVTGWNEDRAACRLVRLVRTSSLVAASPGDSSGFGGQESGEVLP